MRAELDQDQTMGKTNLCSALWRERRKICISINPIGISMYIVMKKILA